MAALAVLASHAEIALRDFTRHATPFVGNGLMLGYLGVDFFFVLSGFIIAYTNIGRPSDEGWLRRYANHRALRIYVPYLPVGLTLAALYTLFPAAGGGERPWSWLASATLMPFPGDTALSVAWTLRHELVFYGLFALLFLTRQLLFGSLLWTALCVATGVPGGPGGFRLGLIDIEFVFGMLAAEAIRTRRGPQSRYLVAGGLAALAAFVTDGFNRNHSVLFGLATALLIVPIVRLEATGRLCVRRWLVTLGDASYAIYLVHGLVVSGLIRLVLHVPGGIQPVVAVPAITLAGVLAGLAMNRFYEQPALAALRRRTAGSNAHAPSPARSI